MKQTFTCAKANVADQQHFLT
uniref:Uncharacterized protein n=1 Tax=Rhizophora mucronata TaxID=61149 RepID=A0A2P2IJA8_RHIMU